MQQDRRARRRGRAGGTRPACGPARRRRRVRAPGPRCACPGRTGRAGCGPTRLGLPVLRNAACAPRRTTTPPQASQREQRATAAPAAPPGESRSPSASASTVDAISRYATMNGSSLTSSAGILENGPGPRHRFSAHATPQDRTEMISLCGDVRRKYNVVDGIEILCAINPKQFNAKKSALKFLIIQSSSTAEIKALTINEAPVSVFFISISDFYYELFMRTGNEEHVRKNRNA